MFVPVRFLLPGEDSEDAVKRLKKEGWKPQRGQRNYKADQAFYEALRGRARPAPTVAEQVAAAKKCNCQAPKKMPYTGLCFCGGRIG